MERIRQQQEAAKREEIKRRGGLEPSVLFAPSGIDLREQPRSSAPLFVPTRGVDFTRPEVTHVVVQEYRDRQPEGQQTATAKPTPITPETKDELAIVKALQEIDSSSPLNFVKSALQNTVPGGALVRQALREILGNAGVSDSFVADVIDEPLGEKTLEDPTLVVSILIKGLAGMAQISSMTAEQVSRQVADAVETWEKLKDKKFNEWTRDDAADAVEDVAWVVALGKPALAKAALLKLKSLFGYALSRGFTTLGSILTGALGGAAFGVANRLFSDDPDVTVVVPGDGSDEDKDRSTGNGDGDAGTGDDVGGSVEDPDAFGGFDPPSYDPSAGIPDHPPANVPVYTPPTAEDIVQGSGRRRSGTGAIAPDDDPCLAMAEAGIIAMEQVPACQEMLKNRGR
jgi:hypothetical protein